MKSALHHQFRLLLAALLLSGITGSAQVSPPAIEWQRSFGGASGALGEIFPKVLQNLDGGFLVAGTSDSSASGNKTSVNYGETDYWVIRLGAAGNKLWENSYGGTNADCCDIALTSDGGCILGGKSYFSEPSGNKTSANYGLVNGWVVKLDAFGNKEWDRIFGSTGSDSFSSVQRTSDGGYILGGNSWGPVSGNKTAPSYGGYDYWLVKLDAGGNKLWDKSFGGSGTDQLSDVQSTSDGGYILGGRSDSPVSGTKSSESFGGEDGWLVKVDANGNQLWDKSFGYNSIYSVIQTSDGGFVLGGTTPETSPGSALDYWLAKVNSDGEQVWEKQYGGTAYDWLSEVCQTSDGNYIVGGFSSSPASGNKTAEGFGDDDYWVLKLDPDGIKIWEASYGGSAHDGLMSVQPTSDGGYVIGGHSSSGIDGNKTTSSFGGNDFWIIKLAGTNGATFNPTNYWTGAGGDGLWSNPNNWSFSAVPTPFQSVVIDLPGSYPVIIENSEPLAKPLKIGRTSSRSP